MPIKAGPTPESLAELKAVVLATKVMDKELRRSINQATREQGNELFRGLLQMNAVTTMDMRMLAKGARVAAGNPPRLIAAASKRKALSGGMIPDRYGKTAEFGVKDREAVSTYERKSKRGGSHQVKRRTRRGLPAYEPAGRVVWPAVADAMPRLISLWTKLTIRKVYDAFEGK